MDRYRVLRQVGDGTYGDVWRAVHLQTGEVVAVKKMKRKYTSWDECLALREVQSLRRVSHPAVVRLREVIRENDELFFVFEHLDCNLYQLIKDRRAGFPEAVVRAWCRQVFSGLAHIHARGYFHRDMKPENLLVRGNEIKIADFGLAREIRCAAPCTQYVSTRWYRAPEVLLRARSYGCPVDAFAMGAIIAEMFTLRPLFPGASEADELHKISAVMGSPTPDTWPEGARLAAAMRFTFPHQPPAPLGKLVPGAPPEALDLISRLCAWDPAARPTMQQALAHPFFTGAPPPPRALGTPPPASERRPRAASDAGGGEWWALAGGGGGGGGVVGGACFGEVDAAPSPLVAAARDRAGSRGSRGAGRTPGRTSGGGGGGGARQAGGTPGSAGAPQPRERRGQQLQTAHAAPSNRRPRRAGAAYGLDLGGCGHDLSARDDALVPDDLPGAGATPRATPRPGHPSACPPPQPRAPPPSGLATLADAAAQAAAAAPAAQGGGWGGGTSAAPLWPQGAVAQPPWTVQYIPVSRMAHATLIPAANARGAGAAGAGPLLQPPPHQAQHLQQQQAEAQAQAAALHARLQQMYHQHHQQQQQQQQEEELAAVHCVELPLGNLQGAAGAAPFAHTRQLWHAHAAHHH